MTLSRARRARWRSSRCRPPCVVLALAALFPEGGVEPYPVRSFAATAVVVLAFLLGAAARRRAAAARRRRVPAGVPGLPGGPHADRAATSSATACCSRGRCCCAAHLARAAAATLAARSIPALALALALTWVVWGPVRETRRGRGQPGDERLLLRAGGALPRGPAGRPGPRGGAAHALALGGRRCSRPRVSLARGWEKQLDTRFDGALLSPSLDARSYEQWLRRAGGRLRRAARRAGSTPRARARAG